MKYNNSRFGSQNLLQLNRTITGALNSCSYADLAVFDIDKNVLQAKRNPFQEMRYLNSIDSNLQFTIEVGGNELCFLDLKSILKDNKYYTTVYSKPTDSHLYLQAASCHHFRNTKNGCFKICRIRSTDEQFNYKSKEYKAYLIGRGHKLKNVGKSFNDALNISRQQSRIKKTKSTNSKNKIVFCSKCNPLGPNIKRIIQKLW